MKTYKRMIALTVTMMIVFGLFSLEVSAAEGINIRIDGTDVVFTELLGFPFIDANNRTQVPFRATLETFGAEVGWDSEYQMAYAFFNDIYVVVPINESYIIVNDEIIENDTAAVVINGRTYCPIRKVLEAFGAEVGWDGKTSSVIVNLSNAESITVVEETYESSIQSGPRVIPQLTILTSFTDIKFGTTEQQWNDFWYNDLNSVSKYYETMSKGNLGIEGVKETSGAKDNGIIQVSLDTEHPNIASSAVAFDNFDSLDFLTQVLSKANGFVDFMIYDTNGDTILDPTELAITIIAAGFEDSYYRPETSKAVSGVTFWVGDYVEVDGVNLYTFVLTGEKYSQDYNDYSMSTIGIVTHEFGHLLGLPDLYDTDYSSVGLDFHALMAGGSNNYDFDSLMGEYPAPMIAWSRIYTGMIEATEVTQNGTYTLYSDQMDYNIIKVPTADPKIYYLVENRQISGYGRTFDLNMDFGGIAIWRIDEYVIDARYEDNTVNDDESKRGVSLIEALGTQDLYQYELDYYDTRYNHYFSKQVNNVYRSPEGVTFIIEDNSQDAMNVTIQFQ